MYVCVHVESEKSYFLFAGILLPVRFTIKHPKYNNRTFANNVGLIKTTLKFKLSDGANFLQLPQKDPTETFINDTADKIFAHGWSKLTYNVGESRKENATVVNGQDSERSFYVKFGPPT